MRSLPRDLHFFMALARQQDDVSRARFADREGDRFAAIGFNAVLHAGLLQTAQSIVDDPPRIFTARIIGGEHNKIASSSGCLAHQRTLGAVPIAAASEHGDYAP